MTDKNLPDAQAGTEIAAPAQGFGLASMWASLVELAKDPTVDPAKMQALASLQESMIDREARRRFTEAKQAAMAEMPRVRKNKRIVHEARQGKPEKEIGRYRDYDSLRTIVDPILANHGLRISHQPGMSEAMKMPTCRAILSWTDGELSWQEEGEPMPLPFDTTGSKSGPQSAASALKYGQRHTMCALLGIIFDAEMDDDATTFQTVPALSKSEDSILSEARSAATEGLGEYESWFKSQSAMTRGWLVDFGHHEGLKTAAKEHDR